MRENDNILLIVGVLILLVLIVYIATRHINKHAFEKIEFEKCEKDDILEWFRDENRTELLNKNKDLSAVVIRNSNPLAKNINDNDLLLALYDDKKEEIADAAIFSCSSISGKVLELFDNKDMILLT